MKSPKQTLSSFVRESLQADLRRRKLRSAAETYHRLLTENEKERAETDEWEAAPLAKSPRPARK